jgi:pseudaminic acid cytidylyltransferase
MTACLIPARGGSRRIPKKNIKPFFGKPIIAYSIEVAQKAGFDVWVSTDDMEIAETAARYGAAVHMRSEAMSRDEVGTQEVAKNFLGDVTRVGDTEFMVLYPCAPLVLPKDLKTALSLARTMRAYVVSVGIDPLRDAGAFYVGPTRFFREGVKLWADGKTIPMPLPEGRVCDINTEADWFHAETLYGYMLKKKEIA